MTSLQTAAARWCLAGLLSLLGADGTAIRFTTILRSAQSQIAAPRQVVIRTAPQLQALWREHAPDQPVPDVDFNRFMVVGIFLGSRPTGGYSVEVIKVESIGSELVVTYSEQRPAADAMVTQALTSPAHLVRVPARKDPVRFQLAR